MKKYSKEHEWIELNGDVATIGITEYAAKELGDITFVELPETDEDVAEGDAFCVVESVKAASDVYAPVTGTVIEANEALEDEPELINTAAESDGWICKISGVSEDQIADLMDAAGYAEFIAG